MSQSTIITTRTLCVIAVSLSLTAGAAFLANVLAAYAPSI